jgi:hypothetical protein
LISFLHAEESLEDLRAKFADQPTVIGASHNEEVAKLGTQLLDALGKLRESARASGNLDSVNALDAEIERWKGDGELPWVESEHPEIAKLHAVYGKAATNLKIKEYRAVLAWSENYRKHLNQLEKRLVAENKIQEAEEARAVQKMLSDNFLVSKAREAVAAADAAKPAPKTDPAPGGRPWNNLIANKDRKAKGSKYFVGGIDSWKNSVKVGQVEYQPTGIIYTHASGRLEFTFEFRVSEFRGSVCIEDRSTKGNVVFRIETADGEIFKSKEIKSGSRKEDFNLKFKPTRKLVLIVDQNGGNEEDWSFWLKPEYR